MAAFNNANSVIQTDVDGAAGFVPELWSDDTIVGYKQNLVVGNLVSKINHNGQKGAVIHIPKPTRGTAAAKVEEAQVTLQAHSGSQVDVTINKHFEYSRLIEDLASVQALDSLRRFYTDDAGYALARQVDWSLHLLGTGFQGGTQAVTAALGADVVYAGGAAVIGGDGTTAWATATGGNSSDLTDAGILAMIQTLDDADVPQDNRYMVIPPCQRIVLMAIDRYTEQAFVGDVGGANTIRNGKIGEIYGIEVFVSTNCPTVADSADSLNRACMLFHRDALVFAEQMGVRSQTQYKQEYLADLMTSDTIYGAEELRNDAGIVFIVPA